jgi:hypothetical protein
MRRMRAYLVLALATSLAACAVVRKPAPQAMPKVAVESNAAGKQVIQTTDLVGRWVLAPGESNVPEPGTATTETGKDETESKTPEMPVTTSPAGAVLTLAEGGTMLAREGDFVRRGTWKLDGGILRLVVEPPPRRLEMGLVPTLFDDRLTLEGTEGLVLVYHRDHFIPPRPAP